MNRTISQRSSVGLITKALLVIAAVGLAYSPLGYARGFGGGGGRFGGGGDGFDRGSFGGGRSRGDYGQHSSSGDYGQHSSSGDYGQHSSSGDNWHPPSSESPSSSMIRRAAGQKKSAM